MTVSIVPLFPDPLGGLDPCQRADAYSDWLFAGAAGLLAETAAVQLLAEHRTWLTRSTFTSRYIELHDAPGHQIAAGIRWRAAVTGLRYQPASPSEKAVLRIAASIGGSVPADLHGCLGTLGTATIRTVLRAIARANSGEAGEHLLCSSSPPWQDPPF
jgi:hypothetical protein